MGKGGFADLEVYQLSEELADRIWGVVQGWGWFEKDTVGKQMVKSADSIGANIAEGVGRWSYQDNKRFVRVARGSLYETVHWMRRCKSRKLLDDMESEELQVIIDKLAPKLNAYLRSIGSH